MPNISRESIDSLFPKGSIWTVAKEEDLDLLLDGIGDNQEVVRLFLKDLANLRSPQFTPILSDLEKEYGLVPDDRLSESERRSRLENAKTGGDSDGTDTFLQEQLQLAGFNILVHINNPAVDPDMFLLGNFSAACFNKTSVCGHEDAVCARIGGQLIVNGSNVLTQIKEYSTIANNQVSVCGNENALAGNFTKLIKNLVEYEVPTESGYWSLFFFVGGIAQRQPLGDQGEMKSGNDLWDNVVSLQHMNNDWLDSKGVNDGTRFGAIPEFIGTIQQLGTAAGLFNGVDNYVSIGNDSSLDLSQTGKLTVSMWIKKGSLFGFTDILFDNTRNITTSRGVVIGIDATNKIIFRLPQGTKDLRTIISNTALNDKLWHHICCTWDFSLPSDHMKLYIDGVLDNAANCGYVEAGANSFDTTIGGSSIGNSFIGFIDEVIYLNKGLSQSEVESLYAEQGAAHQGELYEIETALIPVERREELIRLIIKYKPLHSWCGLIADYI